MPRTNEPGRSVSSRLLSVLFAFDASRSTLTLADIVRRTGLPHATARRLALELVEAGALERSGAGNYSIGLRLWQLGTLAPNTESLRTLAQPVMEDLFTALRQHAQLVVLENDQAVVIERISAAKAIGLTSRVGGKLPLHASAGGKVLLAHSSQDQIERILNGRLRQYTTNTITDVDRLQKEMQDAVRTGIASVSEELTVGADSVAARIMNGDGEVVAALSVVVEAGSVRLPMVQPSVLASGLRLSRMLGWRPGIVPAARWSGVH